MQSCASCYRIGKGLLMCEEKQKVKHLTNFSDKRKVLLEVSFLKLWSCGSLHRI